MAPGADESAAAPATQSTYGSATCGSAKAPRRTALARDCGTQQYLRVMPATLLLLSSFLVPQEPSPTKLAALPELAPPIRIEADDKPIEAVTGHAAPFVIDWDGDGVRDLVVGMFGNDGGTQGGTARVYRNVGSNQAPRFAGSTPLLADGKPAAMESS